MQHSETFAQVAAALAAAQGKFPIIPRDRTVTVQPKPKRKPDGSEYWPNPYSFTYAPLSTILEKVRPSLAEAGLALLQSVVADEKGAEAVRTLVVHSSGEWFANEIPVFTSGADNASQAYASGLTYARRYGVSTLLCLAADDDDDGAGNEEGERDRAAGARAPGGGRGKPSKPTPAPVRQPTERQQNSDAAELPAELTDGQRRILAAKCKAAGLTEEEAAQQLGVITPATLNDRLTALGELAQKRAE